jgi:hypothetical protein
MVDDMKISPLQLVGRILLIVVFVWFLIDSTRIALKHEDAKADSVARHARTMEANAPDVN